MKTISVCVGSACHLKGSYRVIERIQSFVKENNLSDRVEVKAAFCLGNCTKAVSVKTDDGVVHSVNDDTVDEFCRKYILGETE